LFPIFIVLGGFIGTAFLLVVIFRGDKTQFRTFSYKLIAWNSILQSINMITGTEICVAEVNEKHHYVGMGKQENRTNTETEATIYFSVLNFCPNTITEYLVKKHINSLKTAMSVHCLNNNLAVI
jgi:hypothetical protein